MLTLGQQRGRRGQRRGQDETWGSEKLDTTHFIMVVNNTAKYQMTTTITSRTQPEMSNILEIQPPSVTPSTRKKVPVNADQGVVLEPGVVNGVSSPVVPGTLSLSMAAPLSAKFPLTCDSNIYLSLFGEVITCDLKTLGSDPSLIIRLLKTTQSERGNYMIVGASYRRSGFPQSAKAIMETMIQGTSKLTGFLPPISCISFDSIYSRTCPARCL